ncbi:MAG TPA: DUF1080 domain-containing protein [Pirellulales bacterium]|jgi:hypothetical protein|nr:DUF1080 domain-containing protein [Pirellulales bacterium]
MPRLISSLLICLLAAAVSATAAEAQTSPPAGFTALFNGRDLAGWHGMGTFDLRRYAAMSEAERSKKLADDLADMQQHWTVSDGEMVNDGKGAYATTDRDYGDVELLVDYKMLPLGDSGIYLRGTPQVQIWDFTPQSKSWSRGAGKGSGGLFNNDLDAPGRDPLVLADKPFGEWNHFRILQTGARTSVWLNEKLVVDHATWQNYFDRPTPKLPDGPDYDPVRKMIHASGNRAAPLFARGPIQLQTHGSEIRWRNVLVREIPADEANHTLAEHGEEGFEPIFNGRDFSGWTGEVNNYEVVDGAIVCKPKQGGVVYTDKEYGDFVVRCEFKLPPGGNNGLAIRYPGSGGPAYAGMCELQVLDDGDPKYSQLDPRQANGSAYAMVPAHRGYLRPTGEWNFEEVTVRGSTIKVELNGSIVLETDLSKVTSFMKDTPHPGKDLKRGHFGFAGHRDPVQFRNIRIKPLD